MAKQNKVYKFRLNPIQKSPIDGKTLRSYTIFYFKMDAERTEVHEM